MMVDVRPWPKAFRPPPQLPPSDPPQQGQGAAGENGSSGGGTAEQAVAVPVQRPCCFYFMGLSKKKASHAALPCVCKP